MRSFSRLGRSQANTYDPRQASSSGFVPSGRCGIRKLSSAPSSDDWCITVKRVDAQSLPDGVVPAREASNVLFHNVFEGDMLNVTTPFGDLVLQDDDTPLLCLRRHRLHADDGDAQSPRRHRGLPSDLGAACRPLAQQSRAPCRVDRTGGTSAVRGHAPLVRRPRRPPSQEGHLRDGRADLGEVTIAPGTRAYLCGPLPFTLGIREALLVKQAPAENIHYEVFGRDSWAATPA
ncbi:hypothetical protein M2275_003129 [Rhodococcus opacus]|nr:hypothetical protein [Rhodococcus opacus]